MNVAIVGAGLSGLACAYGLNMFGIKATIFEKSDQICQDFDVTTLVLKQFYNSYWSNPFKYLKKKYKLDLYPISEINRIIINGPQKKLESSGNLGFSCQKGAAPDSIENQIFNKLTNYEIYFSTLIEDLDGLSNKFDHVVVATGDNKFAKLYTSWVNVLNSYTRIANLNGDFDIKEVQVWFNTEYSKKGFGYLIPNSHKKAYLSLSVDNISYPELDHYWNKFLSILNLSFTRGITETKDIEYNLGSLSKHYIDNIYFIGNSAGAIDCFLGFGNINAIETGILAAHAIALNKNYDELIVPITKNIEKINVFRKSLEYFDNSTFDILITLLGTPGIKQLVYKNPFFRAKHLGGIAKLYNKLKH